MKKIWDKKSMLNFSRQAYNEKVTDCHALFRILRFFELGCFLGRNIDLGGSFPTHDLKFGQFWDFKKNFGPPKFCWNFSEMFSSDLCRGKSGPHLPINWETRV